MRLLLSLTCLLCLSLPVPFPQCEAGDWPQILGPNRNGIALDEQLPSKFPSTGPKKVWSHPAGSGAAGVSILGNNVIMFSRHGDQEVVECCSLSDGNVKWKTQFPTTYRASVVPNDGPLAVPVVANEHVFIHGTSGILACLRLADGKVVWQKNIQKTFKAQPGYFGPGSSPLLVDDLIIVNVGGFRTKASIVALKQSSGELVWNQISEHASYSSPVLFELDNQKLIACSARFNTYILKPSTGEIHSKIPFGKRGPTVNGANPLILGNKLFLSSSYGVGAVWGEIQPDRFNEIWRSDDHLSSQYATSIEYNKHLIGVHGRQDIGSPLLRCLDPETQSIKWEEEGLGYATLIRAGDKILHFNTTGTLRLLQASSNSYQELDLAQLASSTTRALPALSNGRLVIRDKKEFSCFQLVTEPR